ncbi:hypothetical protein D9M72_110610 [compost metagenome]
MSAEEGGAPYIAPNETADPFLATSVPPSISKRPPSAPAATPPPTSTSVSRMETSEPAPVADRPLPNPERFVLIVEFSIFTVPPEPAWTAREFRPAA